MIKDDLWTWLMMVLWTAIIMILLASCAAEPQAPVESYRAIYGFTPTRD